MRKIIKWSLPEIWTVICMLMLMQVYAHAQAVPVTITPQKQAASKNAPGLHLGYQCSFNFMGDGVSTVYQFKDITQWGTVNSGGGCGGLVPENAPDTCDAVAYQQSYDSLGNSTIVPVAGITCNGLQLTLTFYTPPPSTAWQASGGGLQPLSYSTVSFWVYYKSGH